MMPTKCIRRVRIDFKSIQEQSIEMAAYVRDASFVWVLTFFYGFFSNLSHLIILDSLLNFIVVISGISLTSFLADRYDIKYFLILCGTIWMMSFINFYLDKNLMKWIFDLLFLLSIGAFCFIFKKIYSIYFNKNKNI